MRTPEKANTRSLEYECYNSENFINTFSKRHFNASNSVPLIDINYGFNRHEYRYIIFIFVNLAIQVFRLHTVSTIMFKSVFLINDRKYRRGNQKWTIQRNWQHRVHKMEEKQYKNASLQVRWMSVYYLPDNCTRHQ